MDLWIFLGFVAVLALLAAIEKQVIAMHKDILETKIKVEYISALMLKGDASAHKLPGSIETKDAHQAVV